MAAEGGSGSFDLRVKRYFPAVVDFERTGEDGTGDLKWDSLRGPAKIEARQQLSRERLIAGAEVRDWRVAGAAPHCSRRCLTPRSTRLRPLPLVTAQMKILAERLKWCYIKEGTNHLTNCKDLAEALVAKLKAPYHGMPKAPTREW